MNIYHCITPTSIASHIHGLYAGQSSHIRTFTNSVPQGSPLFPSLFNLYLYDLLKSQLHITRMAFYALKSFNNTIFRHNKETITTVYKQYMSSIMECASPAWILNFATTHFRTLQTIQNRAIKIISGCTSMTATDHIHQKRIILKI